MGEGGGEQVYVEEYRQRVEGKVNYTQGDVRSLLKIEFDDNQDLLSQTILEIIELTNNYLQTLSSPSINTVAKRSDFTNFLVESVQI